MLMGNHSDMDVLSTATDCKDFTAKTAVHYSMHRVSSLDNELNVVSRVHCIGFKTGSGCSCKGTGSRSRGQVRGGRGGTEG